MKNIANCIKLIQRRKGTDMKPISTIFIVFLLILGLKFEIINIPTETVVRTKTNGTNTTISDSVNLLWPFSKDALIADYPFSSTFGPRLQASNSFAYDFHRGIDIPNPMRTPLYAVAAGTIFRSRLSESGDLYVALKLEHTQQVRNLTGLRYFYPIYRHLNESVVVENQTVTAGQLIGYSGQSDSGFDHLHFDIAMGSSFETNNTHPLLYMKYNNTGTPNISAPNGQFFNTTNRKLNITVTLNQTQLDLMGVKVQGNINQNALNLSAEFDFHKINHMVLNKTLLDNPTQTLPNNVIVTVYPEKHNINSTQCVWHFEFDFSPVVSILTIINQYQFSIKAYDVRDGYELVTVSGN